MQSKFLAALSAYKTKKVPLSSVKQVFYAVHPELQNHPERHQYLLDALKTLAEDNALQLPRTKPNWELYGNPALPSWISIEKTPSVQEPIDYAAVAWLPEMGFWPKLTANQLPLARRINDYLVEHREKLKMVPIKERSLRIFGDEKRLDALRQGDAIFGGLLPLSALKAFQVNLPLAYTEAPAPGKPLLVVENYSSYWSLCQWNNQARRYCAVAYGSGKALHGMSARLSQTMLETKAVGIEYLGDLDPEGVQIPLDFNKQQKSEPGLQLQPAMDLYRSLLIHGILREMREPGELASADRWLGPELGAQVKNLWTSHHWIPQEALGLEQLMA